MSAAPHDRANPHLRQPVERWGPPGGSPVVLALHGRGQDPSVMRELARRVDLPGVAWTAPTAAGNCWYPARFMEPAATRGPELGWALDAVDAALADLAARGHDPARVVRVGFSQGACLLAHHALVRPAPASALVLLTGGYVGAPGEDAPAPPAASAGALDGLPVLLATCEDDDWVPLGRVRETAALLRRHGARTTELVEPGGEHGVSDEAVGALRELLRAAAT